MFCFHANGQILKVFYAYFLPKKCIFLMFWNAKIDTVTSLWLSVSVWPKYQKSLTNHFVHLYLEC